MAHFSFKQSRRALETSFVVLAIGVRLNPVPIAGNLKEEDEETVVVVLVTEEENVTTAGLGK